jgi:hypothetical protein
MEGPLLLSSPLQQSQSPVLAIRPSSSTTFYNNDDNDGMNGMNMMLEDSTNTAATQYHFRRHHNQKADVHDDGDRQGLSQGGWRMIPRRTINADCMVERRDMKANADWDDVSFVNHSNQYNARYNHDVQYCTGKPQHQQQSEHNNMKVTAAACSSSSRGKAASSTLRQLLKDDLRLSHFDDNEDQQHQHTRRHHFSPRSQTVTPLPSPAGSTYSSPTTGVRRLLKDQYGADIQKLLRSLQSTEFVGTVDPRYHSKYFGDDSASS